MSGLAPKMRNKARYVDALRIDLGLRIGPLAIDKLGEVTLPTDTAYIYMTRWRVWG